MSHTISLDLGRLKLLTLWMIGASVLFGVSGFRSLSGYYQDPKPLWDWLLPAIVPNLSIMVGTAMHRTRTRRTGRVVDALAFRLAFGISAAYLLVLCGIVTIGLTPLFNIRPIDLTPRTSGLLAALNAGVSVTMGRFFATQSTG